MLRCPPPKFIRLALMASLAISLATCLVPQQGTAGLRDQLGRVTRALGKTAELTGNAGKWAEEATAVVKAAKLTGNAGKWAEEAAALVGAGKLTDAAYRYDDLAITAREAKTPAGEKVALKCEQVAQALRREEGLNRLPPEQRAVIKSLEEVSVPVSGIAFVSIKVKSFAQRFFRGAQEPKEYLHADGVNKEWLLLDSRVVIGQFWRNSLFSQAFPEGLDRYGIFGKSHLISSAYVLYRVCKTLESNMSLAGKGIDECC
jgi:hypothetical protein